MLFQVKTSLNILLKKKKKTIEIKRFGILIDYINKYIIIVDYHGFIWR